MKSLKKFFLVIGTPRSGTHRVKEQTKNKRITKKKL